MFFSQLDSVSAASDRVNSRENGIFAPTPKIKGENRTFHGFVVWKVVSKGNSSTKTVIAALEKYYYLLAPTQHSSLTVSRRTAPRFSMTILAKHAMRARGIINVNMETVVERLENALSAVTYNTALCVHANPLTVP